MCLRGSFGQKSDKVGRRRRQAQSTPENSLKSWTSSQAVCRRFPRKPDLKNLEPVSTGDAARYHSAVGSDIPLSVDRRDIHYAVTELARHMSGPRKCDRQQAMILGKYLQSTPDPARAI